MFVKVIGKL